MRITGTVLARQKESEKTLRHSTQRSGITCSMAEGRLVTLKELRENLHVTIEEAKKAKKDERFWGRMLAAAKAAQATSNVILETFGAFDDRVDVVNKISNYAQAQVSGDGYATARAVADIVTPERLEVAKDVIARRTDLISTSMKGELDTSKVVEYAVDSKLEVAELALRDMGKTKATKIVKVARSINKYAFDAGRIASELAENEKAASEMGSINTALAVFNNLELKIAALEKLVQECEIPEIQQRLL